MSALIQLEPARRDCCHDNTSYRNAKDSGRNGIELRPLLWAQGRLLLWSRVMGRRGQNTLLSMFSAIEVRKENEEKRKTRKAQTRFENNPGYCT